MRRPNRPRRSAPHPGRSDVVSHIPTEQVLLAPWDEVIRRLISRGCVSVPNALRPALLVDLAAAGAAAAAGCARLTPEDPEGLWRRDLRGPIAQAPPVVEELAIRLTASLSVAAELQGLPTLPLFDQVGWVLEPAADQSLLGPETPVPGRGAAVVIPLYGRLTLRTRDSRLRPGPTDLVGGDIVLLRASKWPDPDGRPVRAGWAVPGSAPLLAMVLSAMAHCGSGP